jgi:hypothetical protein
MTQDEEREVVQAADFLIKEGRTLQQESRVGTERYADSP